MTAVQAIAYEYAPYPVAPISLASSTFRAKFTQEKITLTMSVLAVPLASNDDRLPFFFKNRSLTY
jgi:hypothetical protein